MQIRPTVLQFPRFGSNSASEQQGGDADEGVHLGDMKGWLQHHLTSEEIGIAHQLGEMARAEGKERTEQSKQRASGGGRPGGSAPSGGPSPHILQAIELSKRYPGIKKLSEVITGKIAEWRQNPKKKPFRFFVKLSDALRQLAEPTGKKGEAGVTYDNEDTFRVDKARHRGRDDSRRARREAKGRHVNAFRLLE